MGQNCDLDFPLPDQSNKGKSARKQELERYRDILSNLPYGDQERAAHELFAVLHRANRITFKSEERLTVLAMAEEPAFHILSGLQERLRDLAAPIRRNEERVAKALVGTHFELALSYRCLMDKPPVKGVLRSLDQYSMANYLRLAIQHLGEVLRTKYNAMNNPGGTIWKYLYSLYNCAHKLKIHTIHLQSFPWCYADTVEDTFKSIVLLAMSSPLTMRGADFNQLYQLTPELVPHIDLEKIRCGEGYLELATFNLSGTEPPKKQIMSECESCGNASNCFTFGTTKLVDYIKQQEHAGRQSDRPSALQKFLNDQDRMDRLIRNLGGAGKADHADRDTNADFLVEIVVGFNAAHEILSGADEDDSESMAESITLEDGEQWANTGVSAHEHRRTSCGVINHSKGGYCLYIDVNEKFHLWVGELAIVRESRNDLWRPAVISWVSGAKDRMDFGVKVLADKADSSVLRPIYNNSIDGAVNCLLLQGNEDPSEQERVVTAASDFAKGDTLLMSAGGKECNLTVSRVESKTNGYSEYFCTRVDMPDQDEELTADDVEFSDIPDSDIDQSTDFESLWDEL